MGMLAQFLSFTHNRSIAMNNPVIQTDLAEVLNRLNQRFDKLDSRFDKIDSRLNKLEVGQAEIKGDIKILNEKLSGQIESVDKKLSGKIDTVDEKLSGQIKTLDEKVSGQKEVVEKTTAQLDKRIGNQELLNRVIGGSLVVSIISGSIGFREMASKTL